ncbi:MAG: right-handed parallel beta-helix repeat-containing protein [Planctomycetota bacterium]|nr:right-handed parallel beta-helix repeat-containing protein [Planctomycetota bacterium]
MSGLFHQVDLPAGGHIQDWRQEWSFRRQYIVDCQHPAASDVNPGTDEAPFKTINAAAALVGPGEQVLIKDGCYRECVWPRRGGTGPDAVIRYAAYPGHRPVISASKVIDGAWLRHPAQHGVFTVSLPLSFFPYMPPSVLANLSDAQYIGMASHYHGYYSNFRGQEPYVFKRALLIHDGMRLTQVRDPFAVSRCAGSYCIDDDGLTVHVRLREDADPNACRIEISQHHQCFAPALPGLNYLIVEGLTCEHAGGGFAYPMQGAMSPSYGHHWVFYGNTVRCCNGIGIDVGMQLNACGDFFPEGGGGYIVARNVIEDCGFAGLEGSHVVDTVVEYNTIRRCCWYNTELNYENGGIKLLYNRNVLVRNNHIHDIAHANAIWMDWDCENTRVSGNLCHHIESMFGAIFLEASLHHNRIDGNVIWSGIGNGIYQHDCDRLLIDHNLIGCCSGFAIKMWLNPGRTLNGERCRSEDNHVVDNWYYHTGGAHHLYSLVNQVERNIRVVEEEDPGGEVAILDTIDGPLIPVSQQQREQLQQAGPGHVVEASLGRFTVEIDETARSLRITEHPSRAELTWPSEDAPPWAQARGRWYTLAVGFDAVGQSEV